MDNAQSDPGGETTRDTHVEPVIPIPSE